MKVLSTMNVSVQVKRLFLAICCLGILTNAPAQTEQEPQSMEQMLEQRMQELFEQMQGGQLDLENPNGSFFMDTTIIQDFTGGIPIDSLFQSFSFSFPGMEMDTSSNFGRENNPFGEFPLLAVLKSFFALLTNLAPNLSTEWMIYLKNWRKMDFVPQMKNTSWTLKAIQNWMKMAN